MRLQSLKTVMSITCLGLCLAGTQGVSAANYAMENYPKPQTIVDDSARRFPKFYVFGSDRLKFSGANEYPFILFIRVPDQLRDNIHIALYDPGVGGSYDDRVGDEFETQTRFTLYGGAGTWSSPSSASINRATTYPGRVLFDKTYSSEPDSLLQWVRIGSFAPSDGERVGSHYIFKLVVDGVRGNDINIFSVEVLPGADLFTYQMPLRLPEPEGAKTLLHPMIPEGTTAIVERNYDLDPDGGRASLRTSKYNYPLRTSNTGSWMENTITLKDPSIETRNKIVYQVVTGTQRGPNAMFRMGDPSGKLFPLMLVPTKSEPILKLAGVEKQSGSKPSSGDCQTKFFDGSKSFDPGNRKLTYHWDFGDGTTGDQIRMSHRFEKAGEYLVKLTVKNDLGVECSEASTSTRVRITTEPKAMANLPKLICLGDDLAYDATQSTSSSGTKLNYLWDFGDGTTKPDAKGTYKFSKGGKYNVRLTVKDDSGSTCDTASIAQTVRVNTPPVAVLLYPKEIFAENNSALDGTFSAAESSDAEGDNLTYHWDFGDGSTATGVKVNHAYAKGGKYPVTLTVTDDSGTTCNSAVVKATLVANHTPKSDLKSDSSITCINTPVQFDASRSSDADDDKLTYRWDFGDGTSAEGPKASHSFDKPGTYVVKCMVNDNTGLKNGVVTSQTQLKVNTAPTIAISAVNDACTDDILSFTAQVNASTAKPSVVWDFGDGFTATGTQVKHAYKKGGTYKVTVTVDDGNNTACSITKAAHSVTINTRPIAHLVGTTACCVGKPAVFEAEKSVDPDGNPLTYHWDFGDGSTGEGVKVTHIYNRLGTYKAVLTVNDGRGAKCSSASTEIKVNIHEGPNAVIEVK